MTATREQDEVVVRALNLLRLGFPMYRVARHLKRDASNLTKLVRAVLRDDLEHDDPFVVLPHYPNNMRVR